MFHTTVKGRAMIAHSLKSSEFGPAQGLHGSTLEVEVTFYSTVLTKLNTVIDIVLAEELLKEVTNSLHMQNLDSLEEFEDHLTTIEFISKYIWDKLQNKLNLKKARFSNLKSMKVLIHESSVASAGYTNDFQW